jgi:hypothetical protein
VDENAFPFFARVAQRAFEAAHATAERAIAEPGVERRVDAPARASAPAAREDAPSAQTRSKRRGAARRPRARPAPRATAAGPAPPFGAGDRRLDRFAFRGCAAPVPRSGARRPSGAATQRCSRVFARDVAGAVRDAAPTATGSGARPSSASARATRRCASRHSSRTTRRSSRPVSARLVDAPQAATRLLGRAMELRPRPLFTEDMALP